ncbi:hypothetical protein LZ30DRAFT_393957 [Colletotrichum cereale]|nr:hypothetical protein LZ30DRAFT_393957 [Colletotrichum cereale]
MTGISATRSNATPARRYGRFPSLQIRSGFPCSRPPAHRPRYVLCIHTAGSVWGLLGNSNLGISRPYCGARAWSRDACSRNLSRDGRKRERNKTGAMGPSVFHLSASSGFLRGRRVLPPTGTGCRRPRRLVPKTLKGRARIHIPVQCHRYRRRGRRLQLPKAGDTQPPRRRRRGSPRAWPVSHPTASHRPSSPPEWAWGANETHHGPIAV